MKQYTMSDASLKHNCGYELPEWAWELWENANVRLICKDILCSECPMGQDCAEYAEEISSQELAIHLGWA